MKDITPIAKVYGDLIVKELKTINQVREEIRNQVQEYLIEIGRPDLAAIEEEGK